MGEIKRAGAGEKGNERARGTLGREKRRRAQRGQMSRAVFRFISRHFIHREVET